MSKLPAVFAAITLAMALIQNWSQGPAFAASGDCSAWGSLDAASVTCPKSGHDVVAASNSGDGHRYTLAVQCTLSGPDEGCHNPRVCFTGGQAGTMFTVLQDGRPWSEACLTPDQAAALGALTPDMVLAAFRRLTWPSADLVMQPPNGRTLVNLPTVFSTDLTTSATQTVTLLGLAVTIEATPVAYTWHGGDGSSWATGDPGAAYTAGADVDALNTHTYLAVAQVSPSVDVRYHGRYRVAGGAWNDIPQELTVAGPGAPLTVLEARGLLTGRS